MKINLIFFTLSTGRSMGVFIGGLSWHFGRKWASGAHLSGRLASYGGRAAKFCGRTEFGHWIPCAPIFLDILAKRNLKRR
jgi:hypothetical protein